ncbi:MAG: MFS transporter [Pseudomonadales bacterium]|nr:MFS transporter [Pseudomonadales bacterium]
MNGLTSTELRSVLALAGIFASRMMGLFMIMPVIAIYGRHLSDYTPERVGLAIGIYGLVQAFLQIPLGRLSDHVPRKPLIIAGMLLFALGAAVSALSSNIWGVIIGRAIQGAGAISAVAMALLADLTREEHRTKAMAVVGMTIGLSFSVAFVVGPLLAGHGGLSMVFWATSVMALLGALLCYLAVPQPKLSYHANPGASLMSLRQLAFHPQLLRLNIGVFFLHMVMASSWLLVPVMLRDHAHLPVAQHAWVYLPVMLIAFISVVPFIIIAEKHQHMKLMLAMAAGIMTLGLLSLALFNAGLSSIVMGLFLYFMAFNLLEALLPSLISKIAPAGTKGSAMGLFSTFQFLGPALGGWMGGYLLTEHATPSQILLLGAAMIGGWLIMILSMRPPRYLTSMTLHFDGLNRAQILDLSPAIDAIAGVEESVILVEEQMAFLKVDRNLLDQAALDLIPARAVAI